MGLIIGLGTGRCGTKSLAALLDAQSQTHVTHECFGSRVRWDAPARIWAYRLASDISSTGHDGDVAFYWLPVAEWLLAHGARIIGLKRNQHETIGSYLEKTTGRNHWMRHDGTRWRHNKWDWCYPNYATKYKAEAIGLFWHEYYARLEALEARHEGVRIWPTEALNTREGVRQILDHAGIDHPNVEVGVRLNAHAA